MVDKAISDLTDGGGAQASDEVAVVRAGDNFRVQIDTMASEDASDYTPTSGLASVALSGDAGDLTGNFGGNAATATALANPRTIGGVSFDGTADILPETLQASGSAGVLIKNSGGTTVATIGPANGTGVTFAGGVNINGTQTVVSNSNTVTMTNKTLDTPAFLNNPTGTVTSGTYTPTLTNATNITSSTAYVTQWLRVGNVVTVSGRVQFTPTATGVIALGFSLPVASDLTTGVQSLGGVWAVRATTNAGISGGISGDTTNNRANFTGTVSTTTLYDCSFTFTYTVD